MNNYNKLTLTSSIFICAHCKSSLQIITYYNVFSYLYKTICSEVRTFKACFIVNYSEIGCNHKFFPITQWISLN